MRRFQNRPVWLWKDWIQNHIECKFVHSNKKKFYRILKYLLSCLNFCWQNLASVLFKFASFSIGYYLKGNTSFGQKHLANRHLANRHLANRHLAYRHLAYTMFGCHSYGPVFRAIVNWLTSLFLGCLCFDQTSVSQVVFYQ
jgi:hypothetical protein